MTFLIRWLSSQRAATKSYPLVTPSVCVCVCQCGGGAQKDRNTNQTKVFYRSICGRDEEDEGDSEEIKECLFTEKSETSHNEGMMTIKDDNLTFKDLNRIPGLPGMKLP